MITHQAFRLGGSIPALVTPFMPGDSAVLDLVALARLAERAVARGSTALVLCGSTGEAPMLAPEEHARVLRCGVEAAGGRAPVIAGVGAPCTEAAAALAAAAERCGAAAVLCSAPPYVRPSQEGLRAHVRAVAASCGVPVILYDVPARAAVAFADATIARLRYDGAIHALKDASGDLARPNRLAALCGTDLSQLSGEDATAAAHLAMGGVGCISVTANAVPALCAALHAAWAARDVTRFTELRTRLAPLHAALLLESNPVPLKAALGLLRLCDATPRLPLLRAAEQTREALAQILGDIGPLEEAQARQPIRRLAA